MCGFNEARSDVIETPDVLAGRREFLSNRRLIYVIVASTTIRSHSRADFRFVCVAHTNVKFIDKKNDLSRSKRVEMRVRSHAPWNIDIECIYFCVCLLILVRRQDLSVWLALGVTYFAMYSINTIYYCCDFGAARLQQCKQCGFVLYELTRLFVHATIFRMFRIWWFNHFGDKRLHCSSHAERRNRQGASNRTKV